MRPEYGLSLAFKAEALGRTLIWPGALPPVGEIRSQGISSFAPLLINEIPVASASRQTKTYCERIVIGAARLVNLINDALNYTKPVL
jgi:hypothetical protein